MLSSCVKTALSPLDNSTRLSEMFHTSLSFPKDINHPNAHNKTFSTTLPCSSKQTIFLSESTQSYSFDPFSFILAITSFEMDPDTRDSYQSLIDEDWAKLGYLANQELTGSVHSLFQRTNTSRPAGQEHIWPQYRSEAEYNEMYKVMGPVLQMATRILETPRSLDFLYQVAYSPRITSRGERSNQGRPCKEFGWTEPPTRELGRQMTREALRRLSGSISFAFGDSKANPGLENAFASTGPWIPGFPDGVKINDASSTVGMASRVTLNQEKFGGLVTLGDTTPQKMTLQLKVAMTLCHETAVSTRHDLLKPANGIV